jgi:Domain of unknown function (DUF1877)
MGIVYCLVRTSEDNVAMLRGRPKAAAEFLYPEDDVYEEPKQSFFAKFFGSKPEADNAPIPSRSDGDETDLDKSWHVVHYLLCGDPGRGEGPLSLIGDDTHPLVDLDLGMGKPNVISSAAVQEFAMAARNLSDDDFLVRYTPSEMPLGELYMGEVIERGDVDEIREYALENFHILRDFVQSATDQNQAIITYYC